MTYSNKRQETKQTIEETFLQLLLQEPIRQISVNKICTHAAINRTTFYRYFLDKYQILEEKENHFFADLEQIFELASQQSSKLNPQKLRRETLQSILELVAGYELFLKVILGPNGDMSFQQRFIKEIKILQGQLLGHLDKQDYQDRQRDLLLQEGSYAFFALILFCLDNPQVPIADLLDDYELLVKG